MATIRPFDAGGWFPIHNYVFDAIMPSLSPNGWKILCVAIRQTWGWRAEGDPTGLTRREWDQISYSQFRKKAGIASDATVRRALKECLDAGYIMRQQVGAHPGTDKPIYTYALNRDYEATTDSVEEATTDSVEEATTDSVETKQRKQTKQNGAGGGQIADQESLDALLGLGVERSCARKLAAACEPYQVLSWVKYARAAKGLDSPAALVVARLQAGVPAPGRLVEKETDCAFPMCPTCYRVVYRDDICPTCGRCWECCECNGAVVEVQQ